MKQPTLKPSDIVTALELARSPSQKLAELAERTAKSIGESHNAIRRLTQSELLLPESRLVATDPLVQFIRWGVPFAFPAIRGGPAMGVPTARLWPADAGMTGELALKKAEYVWPSAAGDFHGTALTPLYPAAPRLVQVNPDLAALLGLVDLVRIGGARERDAALTDLAQRLRASAAA